MTKNFEAEIKQKERFRFGENWTRFLAVVDDERITESENSLKKMLKLESLAGKSFLDIGSGSGLFSLAARRLGANVYSIDYDPDSVACTQELKHRYFMDDSQWTIEQGSVLDEQYLKSLGKFDVVYSWGVLHHTGAMWIALKNVNEVVKLGGMLFISIYNDQGRSSKIWLYVKKLYNRSPKLLSFFLLAICLLRLWGPTTVRDMFRGQPFQTWNNFIGKRGMSPLTDLIDWVGGYPFEVAKPEEIFDFHKRQGYTLEKMHTCGGGHGCNEFVFVKRHQI